MTSRSIRALSVLLALASPLLADSAKRAPTPLELFEERIMPIFKSEKPSSCVQCHLAAVDLKDYILPSHEKTFASLRSQGLVDLDSPRQSKILTLIEMGERDREPGARLIHEATRQAEYEAFAAWIEACSKDPVLRKLPAPDPTELAGPDRPDAIIRHARKSRVVDSFVRNVWSQRMRCFPCHTPHELDASNPKHRRPIEKARAFEDDYGKEHAARIRLFKKTPEETLAYWIEHSRKTPKGDSPLINLETPRDSLIVLKPTSKLPPKVDGIREEPSNAKPVSHMGGLKMHVDDQSYKSFVTWLEDYAKVVGDRYRSVEELPADNWYPSKHIVMVRNAPASWPDRSRIQLVVHSWNEASSSWSEQPVAFTQNSLTPRRHVVGALFLLKPASGVTERWDQEEATLPPGRYLIKAYVDSKQRLKDDPTVMLGKEDLVGQTQVRGRWTKTFKNSRKIPGERFVKS